MRREQKTQLVNQTFCYSWRKMWEWKSSHDIGSWGCRTQVLQIDSWNATSSIFLR